MDRHRTNPDYVPEADGQDLGLTQTLTTTQSVEMIPRDAFAIRRRSTRSGRPSFSFRREGIEADDLAALARSASAIRGSRESQHESHDRINHLTTVARPKAVRPGPVSTIREVPSEFTTPVSTRPPSPVNLPPSPPLTRRSSVAKLETSIEIKRPDLGTLGSWRGTLIMIVTAGAQLLDNVYMTGVNISLPTIQKEFDVSNANLQWLISAYTLTFGGFLLLAGVLSDRYGRKNVFCAGMLWVSIWTLADGFANSFIQLAIFRALQGIGAAMTVPSAVGIISSYYVKEDRTRALSIFAAAGAIGFCVGLIFGGFLTSSLGWRYVFWLSVVVVGILGSVGWIILPEDRMQGVIRPKLDLMGAGLSTGGLILLSFVLSSGGVYGWSKAFIIALLIGSVALLCIFTFVEKQVSNPIMPLGLWKIPNFAGLWIAGFVMYGGYQTTIYYITLIAQGVNQLSPAATAIRLIPMGVVGGLFSVLMGPAVEIFNTKLLLLLGTFMCIVAPLPCCFMTAQNINFWSHVFPTSVIGVAGVTITYCTVSIFMLSSVPKEAKSLCGGMVNTAFQIGSGVGLALSSAVVEAVDVKKGHGLIKQYNTGLWCCVGLAAIGFVASLVGVRSQAPVQGGSRMGMH